MGVTSDETKQETDSAVEAAGVGLAGVIQESSLPEVTKYETDLMAKEASMRWAEVGSASSTGVVEAVSTSRLEVGSASSAGVAEAVSTSRSEVGSAGSAGVAGMAEAAWTS